MIGNTYYALFLNERTVRRQFPLAEGFETSALSSIFPTPAFQLLLRACVLILGVGNTHTQNKTH